MDPLAIISLITSVAEVLSAEEGAAPADQIAGVLKKLVDNEVIKLPKDFPDLDTMATSLLKQVDDWLPFLREKAGLPQVGGLDQAAIDALKKLCFGSPSGIATGGVVSRPRFDPDVHGEVNLSPEMRAEIGDPGRWLRVFCEDSASGLSNDLIQRAFVAWQDVIGVRVRIVHRADAANVIIKVVPIDGQGGKLAEATVGDGPAQPLLATLCIDTAEAWTPEKFLATMVHEVGHILGIEHINDGDALMNATLQIAADGVPKFTTPQPADIAVAQQAWGEPIA